MAWWGNQTRWKTGNHFTMTIRTDVCWGLVDQTECLVSFGRVHYIRENKAAKILFQSEKQRDVRCNSCMYCTYVHHNYLFFPVFEYVCNLKCMGVEAAQQPVFALARVGGGSI